MKKTFLIEVNLTPHALEQGRDFKNFIVTAKTYEEACGKVAKHIGDGEWKLLGVFEKMETDKDIQVRIK